MNAAPELRRAALERATSLRDPRAAEVLRRAVVVVRERPEGAWESSGGTVLALAVLVQVDGYALGLVETHPAVRDGVTAAISAEAPRITGGTVVDLLIRWDLRERSVTDGYRDPRPEPVDRDDGEDARRALVGFLLAAGDEHGASALADAELDVGANEIDLRGAPGIPPRALEAPLSSLYGRPMRVQRRR